MGATSPHFSDAELACPHCHVNGCRQELVDALESIRALVGLPVRINSAYRCTKHNAQAGGAGKSEHVAGMAADIRVEGMTATQLELIALRIPAIRGIGRDDRQQYIHIDVRSARTLARWCYSASGQWCSYYPAIIRNDLEAA
ncbi:MAG TPA: D-Ala-D-Ala carboxypeptidase family metallohydrolase [Bryobacteraceae bacterium]|jgi:uncharacterized protein YcbK (DUF882 family)|nr:D-Ala-D-Ala carboxypeptidase family metallohydrolase [Bryobacteraceae bacterium]